MYTHRLIQIRSIKDISDLNIALIPSRDSAIIDRFLYKDKREPISIKIWKYKNPKRKDAKEFIYCNLRLYGRNIKGGYCQAYDPYFLSKAVECALENYIYTIKSEKLLRLKTLTS